MLISERLIDDIYEAAVVPDKWLDVFDQVGRQINSIGGILFATNRQFSGYTASPVLRRIYDDFIEDGYAALNPRPQRAIARNYPGFVGDHELFTADEMDQDPAYSYLRRKGAGWCAGTVVQAPGGDLAIFSWEKKFSDGAVSSEAISALGPLRPHLARASLLSGRLGLERVKAAAEILGLIGLPCAVLSHSNRILATNTLFDLLIPQVVQDRPCRVALVDRRADAMLRESLSQLDYQASPRSIPIIAAEETPASIIHVVPVRGAAHDVFTLASCVLFVTEVSSPAIVSAQVIQGLFDLTPAEARVARGIAAGASVQALAIKAGVTVGTIRQQLKSVFAKTGVSRQAELVGMLVGSALRGGTKDAAHE
ncbi:helix-turn-helix transcriptional regulator [Bradyrhizobium brasilense]|uniref:helix-turn-helix transcriptional regulator n=1 Tax=Bradyrhizobium brasilense TaxID=1419277 RepID=UPI0024B1BA1F|nr:helix-turn-helix transcriptional regulator [Bradyrhizobium australafricanum]WFU32396.1 helix-turn-helix transcriptional regulator [Bradyrhizobium australafricanum]